MQTVYQYTRQTESNRIRTRRWACLLAVSYLLQVVFEVAMIQFTQGADGRWVATTLEKPYTWMSFLLIANAILGFVGTVGFVRAFLAEKRAGMWNRNSVAAQVSGADVLYMIASVQIFQTLLLLLYGFFLPYPLFAEGSILGLLESASLQLFIMLAGWFWFHRRGRAIGFTAPVHLWRMMLSVIALFGLIVIALDIAVTVPIADWLDLSLESERETGIRQELLQATQVHWINGICSVLIVGVVAPIGEEILFRGVIQTYFTRRLGVIAAIFISSFWFALIHMDAAFFAPLFVIGAALGLVRHLFGTIWAPILLHSLNNLMSVFVSMYS